MIIYNVTTKVSSDIAGLWLIWLKEEHIPDLVQTGCFTHAVILHLIESDDDEGITYAVQYYSATKALYSRYIENFSEEMRKKTINKWGNKFISFRTLMEVVH